MSVWRGLALAVSLLWSAALGAAPAFSPAELAQALIAARSDLRSAAEAAKARNWEDTQALLRSAELRMDPLLSATPDQSRGALESIVEDLHDVQRKVGSNQKPKVQEILELAQRIGSLKLG